MDDQDIVLRIEVRGIYDGWSVAKLRDGTLVNRWEPGDYRYQPTQDWIERVRIIPEASDEA